MQLRPYQAELEAGIYAEWKRCPNVLAVLPTGGGKTVIFAKILLDHKGPSVAIAHRQELVLQISLALARNGVKHRIIGPKKVVKLAVNLHMLKLGLCFYDADAPCAVAGVRTLIRRAKDPDVKRWANSVTLWIQDEAHHVLEGNEWGSACQMFPNAKGLGVTATATRADGKGLGRHADGLFDALVIGPTMRELINQEYLTDYQLFAPPASIKMLDQDVSKSGDWSPKKLADAAHKSKIVGDVVEHYLRLAPGKLGITFATDVDTATKIAAKFNANGVPAAIVSANTPDTERVSILRRFENRELLQLVNVDLFGEGFDLPAIEVVSMARPTQSYSLFAQQFGRALRILLGKTHAIIIDHVGNIERHCRVIEVDGCKIICPGRDFWTLDAREKRRRGEKDNGEPIRSCAACTRAYEKTLPACPYCGWEPVRADRSAPEFVDGDLIELNPEGFKRLADKVAEVDKSAEDYRFELQQKHVPQIGQLGHVNRHVKRQQAQASLRDAIAWWAGYQRAAGRADRESYRTFYYKFGLDVLSAKALGEKEAKVLELKVRADYVQISTDQRA